MGFRALGFGRHGLEFEASQGFSKKWAESLKLVGHQGAWSSNGVVQKTHVYVPVKESTTRRRNKLQSYPRAVSSTWLLCTWKVPTGIIAP